MTEEEKYQEIVENRKAEAASAEPPKPDEGNPSGVKTDPPAEKTAEPNETGNDEPPKDGDGKSDKGKDGKAPAKPSKAEQQEHALAQLRIKSKRENDALRKEIEDLKRRLAESAPKPAAKTAKDFEKPEEYEKYVRDTMKDELRKEILEEVESKKAAQDDVEQFTAKLREDLEKTFNKEVSDKVFADLNNPESVLSMMITDERAKTVVDAVKASRRRADLLALMQAKPEIFQQIMELPERKQEFRIYQLEDQIEAKYAQFAAKQASDQQKKERADSLPNTGTFGTNGNGNEGVSGLSTTARVNRYKEEILKQRKTH